MALLDQFGNPIDLTRLKVEESAPTQTGVRQVLSDHPWTGMTPRRMGAILREAEEGDASRYLEMAEELEEKDLHYRSVLSTRRLQVSQLPITVEAASDDKLDQADAEFVREHLVDSGLLSDYLFDLLDAVGKGFSVGEIIWKTDGLWTPARIEWRDPRWFEFDRMDGRTLKLKGGAAGIGPAEPLKPFGYVVHVHKTKSGVPIRGGLARAVAWLLLFKNYDVKAWVEFLEGFGQPVRIGKYGPGASESDKKALLRAVAGMWKDSAAIVPDSMKVEWLEAKLTGSTTLQQDFADWVDEQVSKAVLGQTGTTDVGQHVGTAKAHERVKEDIERDDARQVGNTAVDCLVRPLIDLNFGPRPRYPRIKLARPDATDLKLFMDSVQTFVNLGGEVEQSVVRDKIGLPDPPKGADVKLLRPDAAKQASPGDPANPGQLTTAAQEPVRSADQLDGLVEEGLGDWQQQMEPVLSPIDKLLAECATPEEFIRRLPEILPDMDTTQLTEALAKACFTARTAGEVEAEIG